MREEASVAFKPVSQRSRRPHVVLVVIEEPLQGGVVAITGELVPADRRLTARILVSPGEASAGREHLKGSFDSVQDSAAMRRFYLHDLYARDPRLYLR